MDSYSCILEIHLVNKERGGSLIVYREIVLPFNPIYATGGTINLKLNTESLSGFEIIETSWDERNPEKYHVVLYYALRSIEGCERIRNRLIMDTENRYTERCPTVCI